MAKIKISIIIVNWNSGNQLKSCVNSCVNEKLISYSDIFIIDNNSSDKSADFLKGLPEANLICLDKNIGFAAACNLGAKKVQSDFLLFLNPDAGIPNGTLGKTLSFMENSINAEVAICGVQLLNESGQVVRSCARFPTPMRFAFHAIGLDRFFPKLGCLMVEWDHEHTRALDQVIGAFFMVRTQVFKDLGGFDERFFLYFEEVDFSYRAKQSGWQSVYLADVQAFHSGCGTSYQVKSRRLFFSLRSRILYGFKHFSQPGAWLVLLTTLLFEPFCRTIYAIFRRSWSGVKETWSAYLMLLRWLPQWGFKGVTR